MILLVLGCAGTPAPPWDEAASIQRGAEIWASTCNRCHNARPAREFNADQWPVIVNHMRTRADLTRGEAEAVTAFLQELARRARSADPPSSPSGEDAVGKRDETPE